MPKRPKETDLLNNPDVRHLARRLGSTWETCTVADLASRADALTDGELAASLRAASYLTPQELALLSGQPVFWRLLDRVAERTGRAPATLKALLLLGLPIRWPWWRPAGRSAGSPTGAPSVRADTPRGRGRAAAAMRWADFQADPRRRPGSRRGLVLPPLVRVALPLEFKVDRFVVYVEDYRLGTLEPVTLDGLDMEEVVALSVLTNLL